MRRDVRRDPRALRPRADTRARTRRAPHRDRRVARLPRVVRRPGAAAARPGAARHVSRETLDLRGVRCPLSWARAKVRLETMAVGTELELVLDDPQGARDIPRAAESTGHHVVAITEDGGVFRLTIEA